MLVMTKPTGKESKPAKRVHNGTNLNVWLPDELMAAFEAYRKKTRLIKTTQVEAIFETFLSQAGFWPPSEKE